MGSIELRIACITDRANAVHFNNLKSKVMKSLTKNWKTTAAGLIGLLTVGALSQHWITPETAAAIATLSTSLGLVVAKDGNVTGGTKQQ